MLLCFTDDVGHDLIVDEWPYCIVDQNDVILVSVELGQGVGHGLLAVLTALDHFNFCREVFLFQLTAEAVHLALSQGDYDGADLRITGKHPQGVDDEGCSIDFYKLLRCDSFFAAGRHAGAKSCGRNDHNDFHKQR